VYVLRLDLEGKRIGLSLKRLQPNPWALVDEMYHVGQLVSGEVSRVTQFGAFISLEPGIEALLHTSQLADPAPEDPTGFVHEGQRLLMRVISIESHRQRLGLSLKEVTEDEVEAWEAQHGSISDEDAAEEEVEEAIESEAVEAAAEVEPVGAEVVVEDAE